MKNRPQFNNFTQKFLLSFIVWCLMSGVWCLKSDICLAQETSSEYVAKAWSARAKKDFQEVYRLTDECIAKFSQQADNLAAGLSSFHSTKEQNEFQIMIDTAVCYFIKGEALREEGLLQEAKEAFQTIIDKYPWAQAFDERGWYWHVKEKAEIAIAQIDGKKDPPDEPNPIEKEIKFTLYDKGTEFPVNYIKYGRFENIGTKNYKYIIDDPIGLAKACGEGIYPNSNSVKFDPQFIEIKKQLSKLDHWKILNTRNLKSAFYKWNISPEPPAVQLFYIADILERNGLISHAIKAYYAILVHFPDSYSWTYWHTPWYVGKTACYRLKYLLKRNPGLGLKLDGTLIEIINSYDNELKNDVFIVNPGKLTNISFWEKMKNKLFPLKEKKRELGDIIDTIGGERIKFIKYESGDWQLFVENKPFLIKGITYTPTRIGESPDDGTFQNWTNQDLDQNGLIDGPEQAWVDKNYNNIQDKNEENIGDFQLLKDMGVNTLRLYHQPFELNKEIIGKMYEKYGIYIIIGDFLGKYTLGSNADWERGTDYDNPQDKENMLNSIGEMVLSFRNEPYVLMWLIGNENVYGLGCNADKKPESFFKFANEAAKLIKSLDPQGRPVAIASGDTLFLDIFAKNCPDIDVFGTNSYRGKYGFLDLWDNVKKLTEKPAMITEYGAPSYAKGYLLKESEDFQSEYHRGTWEDIYYNSCGWGSGCASGGFIFEWIDEWWKAYEPAHHDKKGLFTGPFLDGYMHEEWLGICSQGDGKNSPYLRQLKKSYFTYQKLWQN